MSSRREFLKSVTKFIAITSTITASPLAYSSCNYYVCGVCNTYKYIVAEGDPDSGLEPGTEYSDFPNDWECTLCGAEKYTLYRVYCQ